MKNADRIPKNLFLVRSCAKGPNRKGFYVVKAREVTKKGITIFQSKSGAEFNNIKVVVPFNDDFQGSNDNFYYDTGIKVRFNIPLSVSKSYLEKYTSGPLINTNSEYISIDSISKENIIIIY